MTLRGWIEDRMLGLIDIELKEFHAMYRWQVGDSYIWNEMFINLTDNDLDKGMTVPQTGDFFSSRLVRM